MKALFIIALSLGLAACGMSEGNTPAQAKITQAQKAEQAAQQITFTENAEIENIKRRLQLTADPGLMGFVVLLNETGQPVMHVGVRGKITSGSKRLTKTYNVDRDWDCGEWDCYKELPAPSDEGTYGSSGEYVYFWTTSGQYIQWNGKYLYSDKPFRLSVQPLVVAVKE